VIRAVLFDLDRTLVDRDNAILRLFQSQWLRVRAEVSPDQTEAAFVARLLALDNKGYANKTEMYERIVQEFMLPSGLARELEHEFRENYARSVATFPDTLATLTSLRRKGYVLGIITNGTSRVQQTKIYGTGLQAFMSAVLISETEGIKKPHLEIFQRALQRLGVAPDEAVFVGDNLVADVHGAKSAGMKAVWYADQPGAACDEADGVITALGELEAWLDDLAKSDRNAPPPDLLVAHDPTWAGEFAELSEIYRAALGDLLLRVEHVGSTAVVGLLAKPILDIDLVIADTTAFAATSVALSALGYIHRGDQGIAGREVFNRADDHTPFTQPPRRWLAHHLYVCCADSRELHRHLAFRDALRRSPLLCDRYAAIKNELARQSGGDRKRYALLKEAACRELVESAISGL
jgi:putative hydrolase of the HAD superfamily